MENMESYTGATGGKRAGTMKENPANGIKDAMWRFLMDGGQQENIPELKASVYRLIRMTTQKTAGQCRDKTPTHIPWETLDMEIMRIVIEATALVLSGRLDELEEAERLGTMLEITGMCCSGTDAIEFMESLADIFDEETKTEEFCKEYEAALNRFRYEVAKGIGVKKRIVKAKSKAYQDFKFCGKCGFNASNPSYSFCPNCGTMYAKER